MIVNIPNGQICQAFDALMVIPEKITEILEDPSKANTSCVCPAYVYMEGTHGKRFLCDYHFTIEKAITNHQTPHLWPQISEYVINNIEDVKKTFKDSSDNSIQSFDEKCTNDQCKATAYVKCIRNQGATEYYCNFHYRKKYYRYLSNGVPLETKYTIIDERYRMKMSVQEEIESLTRL